jgi:hypothetical protein
MATSEMIERYEAALQFCWQAAEKDPFIDRPDPPEDPLTPERAAWLDAAFAQAFHELRARRRRDRSYSAEDWTAADLLVQSRMVWSEAEKEAAREAYCLRFLAEVLEYAVATGRAHSFGNRYLFHTDWVIAEYEKRDPEFAQYMRECREKREPVECDDEDD